MKKNFKFYIISWFILFAIYNVIVFVMPNFFEGESKFNSTFWVGYIFIVIAFIGQLVSAFFAFNATSKRNLFLNLPLVTISYFTLIMSIIIGTICMVVPIIPNWVGIISCLLVLGFSAVSIIKAVAAASIVSDVEEQVKLEVNFIKTLTANAQNLMNRANAPMLKAQCKKVYEALLYSDPVSNDKLADVEQIIKEEFDILSDGIISDDLNAVESSMKELIKVIAQRNIIAKNIKNNR